MNAHQWALSTWNVVRTGADEADIRGTGLSQAERERGEEACQAAKTPAVLESLKAALQKVGSSWREVRTGAGRSAAGEGEKSQPKETEAKETKPKMPWKGPTAGGNHGHPTWKNNPQILMKVCQMPTL